jgi:hypothetical protein
MKRVIETPRLHKSIVLAYSATEAGQLMTRLDDRLFKHMTQGKKITTLTSNNDLLANLFALIKEIRQKGK